ncbi:hypothetical protein, partial [Novosphingobium sp.]|uniref:beta strand repeat-containing protein n=1 Tax=Novosphingobium sp. TaxID=1874826 RepID=UPI0027372261
TTVSTTGTQTYTGAVTLKKDTTLSGTDITFGSTVRSDVDGAAGLETTASGKTRFAGAVGGGGKALKALTTNGLAEIAGGSVITKNAQTYNGAVVLAADTALTSNGGGAITFASTVDSDAGQTRSLTATSTGLTTFGGKVGSTDKLSTLLVNGPSALNVAGTLLAPSIQTTGAQTYTGAVTLGADTVLSGTSATFGGTVNGAQSLDVLGNAVFKGVVGGSTPLTALSVSGTTELDTSGVTTTGTQTYTGAVTLKQDSTLKGSKVTFGSTVKGTHALGIDGDALFKGVVGGNGTVGEVLSALSVTGKSEFDVAGASMAPVSATVTTTGEQTYGGAVTLAQDTVLKGSKVSFAGIVDGLSAGAQRLGVLGDAVFGGNVGAATRLKSVEVIAPTAITAVGSINALEAITLDAGGAIALVDLTTTDTTAGSGNIRINQSGGSGPVTVAGNVSASGDYLLTGTSVVLGDAATRTQQAGLRIAITATAGNITRGSGALTLQAGSDVVVRAMAGSALLERTTAIAGTDVDVAARDDAELVNASATTGFVKVQAGQLASVTGDVSAKTDYTVTGGTGVVLGDGSARTQQAGGKVTVTATTGNVTQGAGLLTLQSDNDGTGTRGANDALRVTASNGSVALGNTVLSGGTMSGGVHGKQSDVFVDAGQNVTVKEAHGRSIGLRASAGALAADKLDALEDVFGKAGTSLTVTTSAIAGDDLSLAAGTNLTINQGTASGTGADGHTVDLSGAVLGVIADAGTPNLANITLSSATGDIAATTLTAQRDVLVTATTGNAAVTSATASTRDVKVVAGGNAALGTGGAGRDIVVDAGNNASLGTGTATNSILVRGVNDAVLGNATTTNAFVTVQAGKLASVTGNVSAKTDYTVTGGTGVVLGDGSARTQKAGGKVTITATTNDVTQGAGLLTLQSDSDGSGGDALSVVATAGSVLLGNSVVQGGSGRQSDVSIDAARNAALAQVDGRNIAVISNQIALGGAMTAATGVTLTNRTSETNDTVIGGTADNDGTKYVLSATEIGRITAPSIQLVTQQASGVTQNVQVGTFALKSGTNLFGIMTSGTPDTAKITLGGAITGSGFTGTLQIGGNSAAGSRSGAIIGQIDTATIDLPGGGLDLRAGQIVFGRSSLLTDAALLSGDAARIARDLVSNAASSLYIQGSGGAKIDTAGNFLRARSMRVAYSDFALFQNTGTPGSPAGVILGDAAQSVSQSAPTLLLDASLPAGREDAFALFGTINGFIGRSAGLLPESVVQFSTGSGSARTVLITQSNSRINGCVIGSPDKGCLVTDVQPPALKLFDERQAQIFSTGDDDGRVLLDPLIATNNEALIGDLAVPTLNYEVPACELTDAGECDKGKK